MKNAGKRYGGRVSFFISYMAVLARLLLYLCPFLLACTKEDKQMIGEENKSQNIHIEVKSSEPTRLRYYDIFVFNDDQMGRLDSYTRIPYKENFPVYTLSRNGNKKITVVANSPEEKYSWTKINSWKSLENSFITLEKEHPSLPVMTGSCQIDASLFHYQEITLTPIMAKIRLKTLSCNLEGTPFSGKKLKEVKCYLTNVSCRYPLLCEGIPSPSSYINTGRYRQEDMSKFADPSMLYHEFKNDISSIASKIDMYFYCYPNIVERPGPAHPYTRLVVEGKIDGNTYYYPIDLKMPVMFSQTAEDGIARGIDRGCEYELDITITQPGTLDPDTAISKTAASIKMTIRNWEEKDKRIIDY